MNTNTKIDAVAVLREADGLKVLRPGTVGYTVALSAVEKALRIAAEGAAAERAAIQPAGEMPGLKKINRSFEKWHKGHRSARREDARRAWEAAAIFYTSIATPAIPRDAKAETVKLSILEQDIGREMSVQELRVALDVATAVATPAERAATVAKGSEQENAAFEAHFLHAIDPERYLDGYASKDANMRWEGWKAGRAAPESKSEARAGACFVSGFSSRVCQLGTKSCMVNHPAAPSGSVGDDVEFAKLVDRFLEKKAGRNALVAYIDARASQMLSHDVRHVEAAPHNAAAPCLPERAPEGWTKLVDDAPINCSRVLDVVLANGVTLEFQEYIRIDWTAVRDWRYTPAAAAPVPAPPVGQIWQPIKSAPKNGRTLLLGRFNKLGNWRTMRGQWFTQSVIDDEWEDPDGFEEGWYETAVEPDVPNCWFITPTHWMPLPAAPSTQPGEQHG